MRQLPFVAVGVEGSANEGRMGSNCQKDGAGKKCLEDTPGTKAFGQIRYIEPLADYLASIRGLGSSDEIPFKLRPRPSGEASTLILL